MGQYPPKMPALKRLRQEGYQKFEVRVSYMARPCQKRKLVWWPMTLISVLEESEAEKDQEELLWVPCQPGLHNWDLVSKNKNTIFKKGKKTLENRVIHKQTSSNPRTQKGIRGENFCFAGFCFAYWSPNFPSSHKSLSPLKIEIKVKKKNPTLWKLKQDDSRTA